VCVCECGNIDLLQIHNCNPIMSLMPFLNWIKTHKLIVLLLLIIAYLYFKDNAIIPLRQFSTSRSVDYYNRTTPSLGGIAAPELSELSLPMSRENVSDTTNRIVTKTSDISLLVKDVRSTGDQIISYAKNNGGFMVFASYNRPTESPFATITVRVPTNKLDEALAFIRSLSIKATSENLVGTDVTEDYIDIEGRLATLKKTQARFEEILDKAISVQDILTVTRELISLQDQIDVLIGQKESIENNAKLTKITVYLSTDELALPYGPDKAFRPNVVFKLAVRSLLSTLRSGAEAAIWIGVYSVIWVPIVFGFIAYRKLKKEPKKEGVSS